MNLEDILDDRTGYLWPFNIFISKQFKDHLRKDNEFLLSFENIPLTGYGQIKKASA